MNEVSAMRYPIFSNWIIYKIIPDNYAYVVKDCIQKNKFVISGEKMRFAKNLFGGPKMKGNIKKAEKGD